MDRRAFLYGMIGVAGAAAIVSLPGGAAQAAPIAKPSPLPPEAEGARTPDGTPVEQARHRYWHRRWRSGGYRRWRRRRRRLVCRYRRRRGRLVQICRRVWRW
jgi:hypothetical protein